MSGKWTDQNQPGPKDHPVRFECVCGGKWNQWVRHYDIVRCNCGVFWWALQPAPGGPLVAFKWPGLRMGLKPPERTRCAPRGNDSEFAMHQGVET